MTLGSTAAVMSPRPRPVATEGGDGARVSASALTELVGGDSSDGLEEGGDDSVGETEAVLPRSPSEPSSSSSVASILTPGLANGLCTFGACAVSSAIPGGSLM